MEKTKLDTYPEAARVIALYLADFCDTNLDYINMIAEASRKASEEIDRLRGLLFTDKMNETKTFVIDYTSQYGKPPTYQIIAYRFNIKRTAAYNRMKYCRELMDRRK